jgi:hypothetical protein
MEQPSLPFHVEQRPLPAHPIVVLRWDADCGRVKSVWPELGINEASFPNWREAIAAVLSPGRNDHVRVKVRI